MMETINKISAEEIEIVRTQEFKQKITKEALLRQKQRIEDLLRQFD